MNEADEKEVDKRGNQRTRMNTLRLKGFSNSGFERKYSNLSLKT